MPFHQCGRNVGDSCMIRIPIWVVEEIDKDPELAYTNQWGRRNYECTFLLGMIWSNALKGGHIFSATQMPQKFSHLLGLKLRHFSCQKVARFLEKKGWKRERTVISFCTHNTYRLFPLFEWIWLHRSPNHSLTFSSTHKPVAVPAIKAGHGIVIVPRANPRSVSPFTTTTNPVTNPVNPPGACTCY